MMRVVINGCCNEKGGDSNMQVILMVVLVILVMAGEIFQCED